MMNEAQDRNVDHALNALPREIAPARDLWPGIEHGLAARRSTVSVPQRRHYLMAASVLLVAMFLTWTIRQPAEPQTAPATAALLRSLQSGHAANKQGLLVSYQGQAAYDERWQDTMQQLEDTEALLYAALLQSPSNRELLALLRQVQRKQLELINAVHAPHLTSI